MPAPRAVLTDLEARGLNPLKAHSEVSDDGHLKSAASAAVAAPKAEKKPAKADPAPKEEKAEAKKPAPPKLAKAADSDEGKPPRRVPRRAKSDKGDD